MTRLILFLHAPHVLSVEEKIYKCSYKENGKRDVWLPIMLFILCQKLAKNDMDDTDILKHGFCPKGQEGSIPKLGLVSGG